MEAAAGELLPLTAEQSARLRLRMQELRAGPGRDELTARKVQEQLSVEAGFADMVLTLGRVKKLWSKLNKEEESDEEPEAPAPPFFAVEALPLWPARCSVRDVLDKGELSIFTIAEKLECMARSGEGKSGAKDMGSSAWYDYRESLLAMAHEYDEGHFLFSLQDEASTQAITLVLKAVHRQPSGAPVFAVEWSTARRSDKAGALASAAALSKLMDKHGGSVRVVSPLEEQDQHWLPQLRRNTRPGRTTHASLQASAIVPPPPAENPDFQAFVDKPVNNRPGTRTCASCQGSAGVTCTGCRSVHYCGRECQLKDWPGHKKVCKKASLPDEESVVLSSVQPSDFNGNDGSGTQAFTVINNRGGGLGETRTTGQVPANPYGSRRFLVKVQVPLRVPFMPSAGLQADQPLMLYDEQRSLVRYISPSEPAFAALSRVCLSKGLLGGAKIYLHAQREGVDVRVFTAAAGIPNQEASVKLF